MPAAFGQFNFQVFNRQRNVRTFRAGKMNDGKRNVRLFVHTKVCRKGVLDFFVETSFQVIGNCTDYMGQVDMRIMILHRRKPQSSTQ
ncbi:hypothetical protein D3C71_1949590 [compost metagenome]